MVFSVLICSIFMRWRLATSGPCIKFRVEHCALEFHSGLLGLTIGVEDEDAVNQKTQISHRFSFVFLGLATYTFDSNAGFSESHSMTTKTNVVPSRHDF